MLGEGVSDSRRPLVEMLRGREQERARLDELIDAAGVTEIIELPNRAHALVTDSGWREVADTTLEFIKRLATA